MKKENVKTAYYAYYIKNMKVQMAVKQKNEGEKPAEVVEAPVVETAAVETEAVVEEVKEVEAVVEEETAEAVTE